MELFWLLLSIALSCSAADPPWIRLNQDLQPNQTEVVLTAGSAFTLSCHGNSSTQWSTTAFRLMYFTSLSNPLKVRTADPRHTGTYSCSYTNQSLKHLVTWIHLYVKDPAKLSSVFVTPRKIPDAEEGQDFLLKCMLTDPSVTNLTLQSQSKGGHGGQGLPRGMSMTIDPRSGALIRNLQRSFKGYYICSGWKDGMRVESTPVYLLPRLSRPPCLSMSTDLSIRLVGENFEVTCMTNNPSHIFNITWTHPHIKTLRVHTSGQDYRDGRLYMNKTLTISAVNHTHGGTYTCTAVNEAGVATATTHLTILDRPFLRIYLQPAQRANANANANITDISGDLVANLSMEHEKLEANTSTSLPGSTKELTANISTSRNYESGASSANISDSTTVEVYEGQDVTLTFVTEAYPPIRNLQWTTPLQDNNTAYKESYTAQSFRSQASLLLHRVRQEDRGRYSLHFSNDFFSGTKNVDLRIYRAPSVFIRLENDSVICSSSGYPLPTILWYTCPGLQDRCEEVSTNQVPPSEVMSEEEEEDEEVSAHLSVPLSSSEDVTVECVVTNTMGEFRQVLSVGGPPTIFSSALIGALSSAGFLLLLSLVLFYKWRQKPRYEIRWKIIESTDGNNYTFIDPTQLPYNQKWEFPRDKLRLGPVLGSGAFGKVVEATAYGLGTDNKVTRVAVKMLKPRAHSEEREALMSELKILSHLGYHDNIVNLLGACTRGGPMLMITEYCSHGDLLNFLRSHSQDFMASILCVDEVEGGAFYKNMAAQQARLRSDSGISCCSEYQEMQPVLSPGQTPPSVQTDSLSVCDLMRFSYQVAQGLDFLSTRNCIHRDVAARNVLLTDIGVAKICDFGLARDIRNDDSYIVQGNARLPVKWMAPESIFQCVYTVQSDVWSYGVLLWEIFSLGKSPYPNVVVDTNFYKMIKDGGHMDQPDYAPAEMYELMRRCWSLEPTDRPTFKMIGQIIDRLLPLPCHSEQTYRNVSAHREEEELRGEGTLKVGEDQRTERHDSGDDAVEQSGMKNIYQLS
ncbi:macrophage colony-stimulating factor 1 receptor 2 [Cheilinus undulatus]|uniref:macrophage colony-stimulating factor 1 receptor 2 n=1 Tax=Cheilinus undulatus TaxID=241271 RepID=UPI001BD42261|nr:macrophage colony-stimulating factor 1 receptor 2 [Cheilinus undulatus]